MQEHGTDELMKEEYEDFLLPDPESGFNTSLLLDLEKIPDDWPSLVRKIALLKRNCFASVFNKYFNFQEEGVEIQKRAVIHYREDETM